VEVDSEKWRGGVKAGGRGGHISGIDSPKWITFECPAGDALYNKIR